MAIDGVQELGAAWRDGDLGRYNLAVLGATGVGKSTLINACFGIDDAATGVGDPVTKRVDYYTNAGGTLGLYDFEGAESFTALQDFLRNFRMHCKEKLEEDPKHTIHGVWYCIKASDRRWDAQQSQIVTELAGMGIPVIVVITQTPYRSDLGIAPDVREFVDHVRKLNLPIVDGTPIPVAAKDDPFSGTTAYNLSYLVDRSHEVTPKGAQAAFAAAQTVDLGLKRRAANRAVTAATASSGVVPFIPQPVPDALLISPIQVVMMSRIARIYNIEVSAQVMSTLAAQVLVQGAGKAAAAWVAKLIPVAGTVGNAAIASAFTASIGRAWTELCEGHFTGRIDLLALIEEGSFGRTLFDLAKGFFKKSEKPGQAGL